MTQAQEILAKTGFDKTEAQRVERIEFWVQHFVDDSGIVCMTKERVEGGGCIHICEAVDQMTAKVVSDTMQKMVQKMVAFVGE